MSYMHIKAAILFVASPIIRVFKREENGHVEDKDIHYYGNSGYYNDDYIDSTSDIYD